jgi:hypothetical protein
MDTNTITVIDTLLATRNGLHYEWFGRHVNVVTEDETILDSWTFKSEPTYRQVVLACEAYMYKTT